MGLKKRPPTHRVDARIVFVYREDDAWDTGRIDREQKEMRERGEDPDDHPVARYWAGKTRFDLQAADGVGTSTAPAADYLEGEATRFVLRRLSRRERARVIDMIRGGGSIQGWEEAFAIGLEDVEGDPAAAVERIGGRLTEDCIEALADLYGDNVVWAVGSAVMETSNPLSPAEKKP